MGAYLDYQKLKNVRVDKDITQKMLSEITNINQNTLKAIETGRITLDKITIKKLTDELGIDIDDVYIENYHKSKVLTIINHKGGCGKTSVAGNLGYALSEKGNRILLIDADMQCNLTHSFNLDSNEKHLGKALIEEESLVNYIIKTKYKLIDIVVSSSRMASIEMSLVYKVGRENILNSILAPVVALGIYDFIIIDTNPALGILNFNVLNATNFCIVPVTTDSFGVENIDTLLDFIEGAKKFNKGLEQVKILFNKYDIRNKTITLKCEKFVKDNFSDLLLDTILSVDTNIQNAQFNNEPVLVFKSNSRISKEYRNLCKEIIKIAR